MKNIHKLDTFNKFILPGLPSLRNLIKYTGNSEIEKFILDRCIFCICILVKNTSSYLYKECEKLNQVKVLINDSLIENLFEVINRIIDK